MKIIALYGAQCAGKTTIAKQMETDYGFTRFSFADGIRRMLSVVYPIDETTSKTASVPVFGDRPLREVLQSLGSWGRTIDKDFWVTTLLNEIALSGKDKIVIDDLRFHNELTRLRSLGALIVKIRNPYAESRQNDNHESELDWPVWIPNYELENDYTERSLPDLAEKINIAAMTWCDKPEAEG